MELRIMDNYSPAFILLDLACMSLKSNIQVNIGTELSTVLFYANDIQP